MGRHSTRRLLTATVALGALAALMPATAASASVPAAPPPDSSFPMVYDVAHGALTAGDGRGTLVA